MVDNVWFSSSCSTPKLLKVWAFEHGETPGLGGEIDNPSWKKLWVNKVALIKMTFPRWL